MVCAEYLKQKKKKIGLEEHHLVECLGDKKRMPKICICSECHHRQDFF